MQLYRHAKGELIVNGIAKQLQHHFTMGGGGGREGEISNAVKRFEDKQQRQQNCYMALGKYQHQLSPL